jgi:hypothetical protein
MWIHGGDSTDDVVRTLCGCVVPRGLSDKEADDIHRNPFYPSPLTPPQEPPFFYTVTFAISIAYAAIPRAPTKGAVRKGASAQTPPPRTTSSSTTHTPPIDRPLRSSSSCPSCQTHTNVSARTIHGFLSCPRRSLRCAVLRWIYMTMLGRRTLSIILYVPTLSFYCMGVEEEAVLTDRWLERYFLLDEHLLKGIRGPVGKDGCVGE